MVPEKAKILVVDDDPECLQLVAEVLTREGYQVITAVEGREGVEKARNECPRLIILDVLMPEQDGWDTCDELRSEPDIRTVPIIYLTCVDVPKTLYAPHGALETDWDEYLTKPVAPGKLVAAVKRLLGETAAVR